MNYPAFKEWSVIVEALGSGQQIIILRKGGIAEGRAGFQIEASRFWLFPTRFHEQLTKTKPAAARWYDPSADHAGDDPTELRSVPTSVTLRYFADIVRAVFIDDWPAVTRLDAHHFWTETTVRERFNWSKPAGLHAMIVRVHKLTTPLSLPLTPDMSGCKSWIELPWPFHAQPSLPVLPDAAFAASCAALSL